MEELGPQVRQDSRSALFVRWPQRAARLPNSCGGPLPPPQAQPVVASHPRPLAAMSCRNLRRWPELDHLFFKVLSCSASGANEPDTIVRSRIRHCSLWLVASAVWQIQSATDPRLALSSRYLTHGDFPTTVQSARLAFREGRYQA